MKLLNLLLLSKCAEEQHELLKLENIQLKQIICELTEKVIGLTEENQELIVENKELVDELNNFENECTENLKKFNKM